MTRGINKGMTKDERLKLLTEYIERTKQILTLSSPQLDDIKSAEDYRMYMQDSFRKIGSLGLENITSLDECFFPMLERDHSLSDDEAEVLRAFSSMLIDTTSMENVDLPLVYMQAEKLLGKAEQSGDVREIILAADNMVIAACMLMNLSLRFYPDLDECFRYRDIGLHAGYLMLDHLPKDKFAALPDDECRELVLINSRYIRCLFEWDDLEDKTDRNIEDIRLMERSLALADDPFYRDAMPDYKWDIHIFRTLQYLADFTEDGNVHEYNHEQLCKINNYTKKLIDFLAEHPEIDGCPPTEQSLYIARNGYLAGEIAVDEYRSELERIMRETDSTDFGARSMFIRFTAPLEYIYTLDRDDISEDQQEVLRSIYRGLASYAYHMPKTGVLSFMLNFISDLLKNFIEFPGGISISAMCRQLIAAMHPPTYVHTLSVAAISKYLTGKLIEREPEIFVGIEGTESVVDVLSQKAELEEFVYNGALLHDIGKLFIVETILTYGRGLTDLEFEFIKAHTTVGAALLRMYNETAKYADIALAHQLWYDGSRGYPEEGKKINAKSKVIADIVAAADCIDAATDSVGRSYKKGKSVDEVIEELRQGSGSRYAPYVVQIFDDPSTKADLERLLTEGRDENYRITFRLLREL